MRKRLFFLLLLFILYFIYLGYFIYYSNKNKENYLDNSPSPLNVLYSDMKGDLGYEVIVPPGTIMMWTSLTPPVGWKICDGTNETPDLRSRFVVGSTDVTLPDNMDRVSSQSNSNNMGGVRNVTLTPSNISHTHTTHTVFDKSKIQVSSNTHYHNYVYTDFAVNSPSGLYYCGGLGGCEKEEKDNTSSSASGGHIHTLTIDGNPVTTTVETLQGSNLPMDNCPPYYALSFIMKI